MVTITASYTVIPEEPTPQGSLWLSDIDQVVLCINHINTFYIYKPKQNKENVIKTLKNSLSKILVHYYPIAGRFCYNEDGRLELNLNAKGVILVEAETTKTMNDYGDFSPSESTKELVPIIDFNQPLEEIPTFLVQLTKFQNNEAFAIGISIFHPLSDGSASIRFINSWAKIARGEKLETNELPFFDRTILKFSHTPLEPCFEHIELKPHRPNINEETKAKTTATLLKVSSEQVEKLKKKANESYDILATKKKGSKPFSRYEVIGAHIWKCASKARELDENQQSFVKFHADIRSRIIPPLPKNYFGNAIALAATKVSIGEIISKSLGYLAQKIREGTESLTNEFIRSQIDVIRGFKNVDDARGLLFGDEYDAYFGNPDLHLTVWMGMPFYEADFGWGKPIYFGVARVSPLDKAYMILSPDGDGDGSVIVNMHFQIAYMELFKKFFYEDM